MGDIKEYITYDKEMNRRKTAFLSLELSILITICLFFYEYILLSPRIAIIIILFFITLLLFIYNKVSKMLDKQKNYKFYICNDELHRELVNVNEVYLLNNLESIRIKRTSQDSIREISLYFKNNETVFINGIRYDEFELLLSSILSKNTITVNKFKEPINLDHFLFYPILGMVCGTVSSIIFKLMLNINEDTYMVIKNIVSLVIMLIGIFWFIKKPISRTYGKNVIYKDIAISLVFLIVGLVMLLFLSY